MDKDIAMRVGEVRRRIEDAAARAGRDPLEVLLVAVSKTRTPPEIEAAYAAGVRHIGENRVGEAEQKRAQLDLPGAVWHMVGHVQSRKAARTVSCFDVVQSVDSVKLARRLDAAAAAEGQVLQILIEVNVGGEASKYGFRDDLEAELAPSAAEVISLPHLRVDGLMTVAPISDDPEQVRPIFARLRWLRDVLRARFPECGWMHLSMGMTDDFEVAVEEGATMVRVGRAIYGSRS
ncbi:MAG: YggS family pyridoxal phosphate-dependent enzyme [Anaerolineae bacterium]|nr:YggS family pyridoxal phosphate-dependent enzyme [Anaerolineae bacterium]